MKRARRLLAGMGPTGWANPSFVVRGVRRCAGSERFRQYRAAPGDGQC